MNNHNFLILREQEIDEELHSLLDAQERREQLRAIGHDIVSGLLHRTAHTASVIGMAAIEYLESAAEAGKN